MSLCIAPSREISKELVDSGIHEQRVSVIPNGVDTVRFSPATVPARRSLRAALGIPDSALVAAFAGRFQQGKGLELLVNAWKDTLRVSENKNIFLLLIGAGPMEALLKNASLDEPRIIFTGWENDPERYLAASDIFILPSYGEGMPNTLLEAMSSGCACLATRIGGVTDIIEDGINGLLFSPGDRVSLAALLVSLISKPERTAALGTSGRQKVCADFSLTAVADRYIHLYSNIISRKGDTQ